MSQFKAELPTMQSASQHVFNVNDNIQSSLSGLLSRLEPLQGAWKGAGSTSFHSLIDRWHQDASQLNTVLRSVGERLGQTHTNMTNTEGEVHQSFTSIQNRLG
jgi:WXG100 family type VII secretion target